MMMVKFDRDKSQNLEDVYGYSEWARVYRVDLSQSFIVTDVTALKGRKHYKCVPPPSLKDQVEAVYLSCEAFFPVDIELKLEDYL